MLPGSISSAHKMSITGPTRGQMSERPRVGRMPRRCAGSVGACRGSRRACRVVQLGESAPVDAHATPTARKGSPWPCLSPAVRQFCCLVGSSFSPNGRLARPGAMPTFYNRSAGWFLQSFRRCPKLLSVTAKLFLTSGSEP